MVRSATLPMTRRCFFASAGLAVAATGVVGAKEKPSADTDNMPKAALLRDGDAKTYLLEFHTGQEVMNGLLAFARKHRLVAGHLTGIGAISDAVIGYFDPQKKVYELIGDGRQPFRISAAADTRTRDFLSRYSVVYAGGPSSPARNGAFVRVNPKTYEGN